MGRQPPEKRGGGGWVQNSPLPFSLSPPSPSSLHQLPTIKATNSSTTLASMVVRRASSARCGVLSPASPAPPPPPTPGSGGGAGASMAHGTHGQIGTKYLA